MITLTPNFFTTSMGKKFKIVAICDNVDKANEFCEKNPDVSVFKETEVEIETGIMIFIAETNPFPLQDLPKGSILVNFL